MKKLLSALVILMIPALGYCVGGADTSLTVSSGTFLAVDLITNNDGNNRQAVVIGDPIAQQVMKVDTSSSAFVNLNEIGGSTVTLGQTTMALSVPVTIASNQPAFTITPTTFTLVSVATVTFNGVGQPVNAAQTGTWNVNNTSVNVATVTISGTPTVTANAGSGTFTVSGTVTANAGTGTFNTGVTTVTFNGTGQPVTQSGAWTVQPGNTPNTAPWLVNPSSGSIKIVDTAGVNQAVVTASNALKVDGSGVTQPVSGTVTSNAGTGIFNVGVATITHNGVSQPVNQTQVSTTTIFGSNNYAAVTSSGAVACAPSVNEVRYGTNTYTVQFSTWGFSASGYNIAISTAAGNRIVVLGWDGNASGTAVNIQWQSTGGAATNISGLYYFAVNGGAVHECAHACFQTLKGEGLAVNLSAAQAASGTIEYIVTNP